MVSVDASDIGRRRYLALLAMASLSGCSGVLDDGGGEPTATAGTPEPASAEEWPLYERSIDGEIMFIKLSSLATTTASPA